MKTLESIGQMRSLIFRSLLYFYFGRRLFQRYIRLWAKYRRQRRALDKVDATIAVINARHDRELRRRDEMIAAQQTKIEVLQRETVDRVLESMKLIGTSYATREADERIQETRYRPIDRAKRANPNKSTLYNELSSDAQLSYDDEYESHVNIGRAQGLDDATIARAWRENEQKIVEAIDGGASVSGGY